MSIRNEITALTRFTRFESKDCYALAEEAARIAEIPRKKANWDAKSVAQLSQVDLLLVLLFSLSVLRARVLFDGEFCSDGDFDSVLVCCRCRLLPKGREASIEENIFFLFC